MNVSFGAPLQLAWARMARMLFRPFSLEKWLVLGFAAFLSEYGSGTHSGGWKGHRGGIPGRVLHHVHDFVLHPFWAALIVWVCIAAVALAILLLWINARGKFIFLHNVLHERAGIIEPWKRFKRLGNSLFGWSLIYWLVIAVVAVVMSIPFLGALVTAVRSEEFRLPAFAVLLGYVPLIALLVIAASYFFLFLHSFVVPIMYQHDLTTTAAWARFMPLLRAHAGSFILYGLLVLVLSFGVGVACAVVGFATCCVGFVLLILPYVGAVIMLPVEVLFRALGPEFLAQFGPEWSVFPAAAGTPATPPGPGGGAGE